MEMVVIGYFATHQPHEKSRNMKHFFLFVLTLFLCEVIALSYVSPGVTVQSDGGMERVAQLQKENTPQPSRYSVSGDRWGRVTVKDATTGQVIRSFPMDFGVVIRETFLLDGGKTVAASQKDHTIFWDLATGREIHRFPQRIYSFSHDETKFFTWKAFAVERNHNLLLYSYPDMKLACKMLASWAGGPEEFNFSPNDRFLAVSFYSGVPLSDEDYLNPPMQISGLTLANLFDLQMCQVIEEFSKLLHGGLGEFSPDSNFYIINDSLFVNGRITSGPWYFNLNNHKLEKF